MFILSIYNCLHRLTQTPNLSFPKVPTASFLSFISTIILSKFKFYPFFCCGGSVAQLCLTFCDPLTVAHQPSLSFIISWSLFKVTSTELVMPSNHLIPCHPLLLLPSIFPSIRFFLMSQLFRSGSQSTKASDLASVLPINI